MEAEVSIFNISRTIAMYDYSYVLGLLRVSAADLRRRALSNEQAWIARMTTERTLRNRALAIIQRLQGMAGARRRSFVEAAIRHL
jgi:hypothetical protein